jgi:hypothetical protein
MRFVSRDPSNVSPSDELAMAECQCCINGATRLNSMKDGNSTPANSTLALDKQFIIAFAVSRGDRQRSRIHSDPSFMNIYVRLLFLQLRSSTRLASCACRKDNEAFTYACNRGTSLLTRTFNYESALENGARARQLILVGRNVRGAD